MTERTTKIITGVVIPVLLAIALIVVSLWGAQQASLAEANRSTAVSMYRRAFMEMMDHFYNLETTLSKLQIVNSPTQYVLLLDDVWRLSGACVGLMSQIPASHVDTAEMNQFVVRLGDYARQLTTRIIRGQPVLEDDQAQLNELHAACVRIAEDLNQRYQNNDIPVAQLDADGYFESAANEYQEEDNREQYPTLIYDGPFSESAEKAEPKGLEGEDITEEEALNKAKEFAGEGAQLTCSGLSDGNIPAYDFSGTLQNGANVDISVTRKGGRLLWMMGSTSGSAGGMADNEESQRLKQAALDYLNVHGYDSMQATYAQYYDGAAVINFAATQQDVILYSDLVKVWVDRQTAQVIGLDARNYLYSHVERELEEPKISMEEAESMLNVNLKVADRKLALIPLNPVKESLCYEFKGTFGEEEYIVYINVSSGEEEQIFKIINSEEGQLVI